MTFPLQTPTVAKVQLVIDFIKSLGWNTTQESGYPLFPGPEILDAPDRAVFVTLTPGPGFTTEEAGNDCQGFQLRLRGASDDPTGADLAAQQLDVLILNSNNGPVTVVDGLVISVVSRSGGPPVPLPLDPADRRFEYVCTYLITTGLE